MASGSLFQLNRALFFCLFVSLTEFSALGQSAQIAGTISDSSKAVIPNASLQVINTATQVEWQTKSNGDGRYALPLLPAGTYDITAQAYGFEAKVIQNMRLNVADRVSLDFVLQPGAVTRSVTVDGSGVNLNTTDANVSTVVDRRFVENIPLNGRSFQSLMTLAPGVSVVPSQGVGESGELSVNGQRTEANYFTVDGVSVNTGASVSSSGFTGAGFAGATPGETALGTTQSMVSIDVMQEFRAVTSTYSAEYGRTPGGQFEIITRSGTNQYHGTLFDYLRNDALDANSWFNNYASPPVAKQALRQNDFGGTLGGYLQIPRLYMVAQGNVPGPSLGRGCSVPLYAHHRSHRLNPGLRGSDRAYGLFAPLACLREECRETIHQLPGRDRYSGEGMARLSDYGGLSSGQTRR